MKRENKLSIQALLELSEFFTENNISLEYVERPDDYSFIAINFNQWHIEVPDPCDGEELQIIAESLLRNMENGVE